MTTWRWRGGAGGGARLAQAVATAVPARRHRHCRPHPHAVVAAPALAAAPTLARMPPSLLQRLPLPLWPPPAATAAPAASAHCPFCSSDEDVEHLFLRYTGVATIWHAFGLDEQQIASLPQLEGVWDIPPPGQPATPRVWHTILLAVMWNIWKRRNNKVFNSVDDPASLVLQRCASDIDLCSHRCKNAESKQQLRNWASYLYVIIS
uniref:Reverse transcriptase zinc-binding domain-containing protein n=1 Tax=Oryza nivara TaxID=4536 RepID=A0A0E0IR04_ORYNI